ncbi:MAG: biopolymer transporter ExbD [Taibaiella sp.]|nr:biopolymer transporter ExbD [Taibaiella sp.]
MNLRGKSREGARVHMEALNDILFILLFFFLIIATLANPNIIQMANAKAESDAREKQNVVVSVDADANYFVGSDQVSIEGLQEAISAELSKQENTETPVIVINSDSTTDFSNVMAVMRIARQLKAKTVVSVAKP